MSLIEEEKEKENELTPKKLNIKRFNETKEFILKLCELLNSYKDTLNGQFKEEVEDFYTKYYTKIKLERFWIGIFGKISSGKSTLLNYLLGLKDILQTKKEIATKFICFIRHNKNNEVPKFYDAIPENRIAINGKVMFFNFKKGEEIVGDINEIISQRNKEIIETEKNEEIILERLKYFIIIEANLTIFNEPALEKYSEFFEFLDIPGLDEGEFESNYYVKNLIPIIIPNLAFSIFIFNKQSKEDISSTKIVKYISMYYEKNKIFEYGNFLGNNNKKENKIANEISKNQILNSLYIINKVDNESENDTEKKSLRETLTPIFQEKQYLKDINELNIIPLSARNLLFEQNELEDFYCFIGNAYTKYIKLDEKTRKEFKSYLKSKLNRFSNEEKNGMDEDDSSDSESSSDDDEEVNKEEEIKKFSNSEKKNIEELITEIKTICNNFSMKEYIKFSKKFKPINKKKKNNSTTKELYDIIHIVMTRIIENFNSINEYKKLYEFLKEQNGNLKLNHLVNQINLNYQCLYDPIKILEESEYQYKNELSKIEMETGKNILSLTENMKNIFKNQINLNYLLIGKYNSGKSTTLNTIFIGYDILPTSDKECTKIGVILNHCDNIEDSSLYKVDIKNLSNDEEKYYYFDYDQEKPLVKGIEQIKIKLIEVNKLTKENQLDYYLVKCPLKLFEYIDNDEIRDLRTKIHIIDFPGLDTNTMKIARESKSQLLELVHGFIFINRSEISQINDSSSNDLINELLEDIRKRDKFEFSFKSCLFLMISEEDKDVEKFRKELNININKSQSNISTSESLKNPESEIRNDDVQIFKFSNYYFKNYLNDYEALINDKIFYQKLQLLENKDSVKNYYEYLKSKINLKKVKEYEIPKEKEYIIDNIKNNLSKNINDEKKRKEYSEKIAKYYYYIINHKNELITYQNSGFENLKYSLKKIFLFSNNFYQQSLKKALAKHFDNICQKFIWIKNTISKNENDIDINYFEDKNNEDQELNSLDTVYEDTQNKINEIFYACQNNILNHISELNNYLNESRGKFKTQEDEIIKESQRRYSVYTNQINELINNMNKRNELQQQYILTKTKKGCSESKTFQSFYKSHIDAKGFVEKNFLEKAFNITPVVVLHMIPVVNLFAYGVTLFGGLIDRFRNHSEEFKIEIKRIREIFSSSIEDDKKRIRKNVYSVYFDYKRKIKNIFTVNGIDLKIIKNNKGQLIILIKKFEAFLESLLLNHFNNNKLK